LHLFSYFHPEQSGRISPPPPARFFSLAGPSGGCSNAAASSPCSSAPLLVQ
jgi:hypothetical protein